LFRINRVVDLLPLALNQKMPDVLLYGRAGYLYSLLLLKKLGWEDPDRDRLIRKVTNQKSYVFFYFVIYLYLVKCMNKTGCDIDF